MKNDLTTSSVCTTMQQSKKILDLGFKRDTADCFYDRQLNGIWIKKIGTPPALYHENICVPAWSLDRLKELMPKRIDDYEWTLHHDCVGYISPLTGKILVGENGSTYDSIINLLGYLVENNYIDTTFLNEER